MIIDCDSCEVRGGACGECVIGVLLGVPGVPRRTDGPVARAGTARAGTTRTGEPPGASTVQLDAPERRALDVLADQGLVPRLRLVAAPPRPAADRPGGPREARDVG
jgi:hypothetical protein